MLNVWSGRRVERSKSLTRLGRKGNPPSALKPIALGPSMSGRSAKSGSNGADRRSTSSTGVPAEQPARPRARLADATRNALSAPEFARFLERERCLADRGTRRFSLLVLERRCPLGGETRGASRRGRNALAQFARQACQHLRSTDVVGHLDAERVEVLLTDTEPAGAEFVARWVDQVRAELGLDLEQTIYVYPSVEEMTTTGEPDGAPREDFPHAGEIGTGHVNGPVDGHARIALRGAHVQTGSARAVSWAMADLWPRLGVPTPRWKRSLDIAVSASALLMLSPIFAVIALAIRLDSPGPVIFRQKRAGRSARPFAFYKFRSMIADAEAGRSALADKNEQDGPVFKIRGDPRITRVGRWLRRWSIDELPQLWNVLKGDISLVGPRSPTLDEVSEYERWQLRRLCVTGGITCIWQVSGRSKVGFIDWMRLDMRYLASRNLWLDLRLLALTLPAVISGRGAF